MNLLRPLANYAARVFALDVRPLALFRMALGGLLLVDLAVRASDFSAMYAADGFAPAEFVRAQIRDGQWSAYVWNGSSIYQASLQLLAGVAAAALLVGYRTRLATIASWLLLASLHVRLPIVVNAGDTLLRMLLFWSMFLPLGAAWSLDARRRPSPSPSKIVSIATAALIIQLSLIYWGAGIAKWNDSWLHGDALHSIFAYSLYSLPLGHWLHDYPDATRWLTWSVVCLELLGPLLLFSPWATAWLRIVALAAFALFHVGIAATVTVGLFSYVAIAAWLALIPSSFYRSGVRLADSEATTDSLNSQHPSPQWLRLTGSTCCLLALLVVLVWNAVIFGPKAWRTSTDPRFVSAVRALGLHQTWGVFRRPTPQDSWFVYEARLNDGRVIDLLTGQPARDYSRPTVATGNFPNHRWRKLHSQLRSYRATAYRQPVAEYMARRWNASHADGEQIAELHLYCYSQRIESTETDGDYVRQTLAQVSFGAKSGAFADAVRELDL